MRCSAIVLTALVFVAGACGESREEPAAEPAAVAEDREQTAQPPEQMGLDDLERERLKKEYAAEAIRRITAENAEKVGNRLLADVERELAAERAAAADAGNE